MLEWLQEWYETQCDGNWEHNHVIKIETLDNPGWDVEIDFNNTNYEIENSKWKFYELSSDNWIGYEIQNNVYSSSGDSKKLYLILEVFRHIVENNLDIDKFINNNLVG